MKILINRCYGGFGLSESAMNLLAERGFEHAITAKEDAHLYGFYSYDYYNDRVKMTNIEFRSHPMVIQVVEELGDEANGPHSKLQIVEINLDHLIDIADHDGKEKVIINGEEYY